MTVRRVVYVSDLGKISEAMGRAPEVFRDVGRVELYNVMSSRPRSQMLKRTPRATVRRYQNFIRKDGKKTKTVYRGVVGTLHRAAENGVRVNGDVVEFGVRASSELDYAEYVHEAVKPADGEYWAQGSRGYGRGWTTRGTGAKFVQRPLEENADFIPEALTKLIDKRLEEEGL